MYGVSEISHNTKETSFIRTVSRTFEHELVPRIILSNEGGGCFEMTRKFRMCTLALSTSAKDYIHPHEEEAKTKMRMPVDIQYLKVACT